MIGPGKVGLTFLAAVIAAVVGWFAGGAIRDVTAPAYDTAVAVVEADVGAPVETASPSPTPSEVATPSEEPTPTETPEATRASILCEGDPPEEGENCDCDLQDGEWVWVCELPTTSEPEATEEPGDD